MSASLLNFQAVPGTAPTQTSPNSRRSNAKGARALCALVEDGSSKEISGPESEPIDNQVILPRRELASKGLVGSKLHTTTYPNVVRAVLDHHDAT